MVDKKVAAALRAGMQPIVCLGETLDERQASVVKLRFFAGFTTSEAADVLEITTRTAERYWAFARAWLVTELKDRAADGNE